MVQVVYTTSRRIHMDLALFLSSWVMMYALSAMAMKQTRTWGALVLGGGVVSFLFFLFGL